MAGSAGNQIELTGVSVATTADVGDLKVWARWEVEGEWEQISIDQQTRIVSGRHAYLTPGTYKPTIWA